MIGRVNHIALAVPDLAAAIQSYKVMLGAKVSVIQE
jgi:catechol 2,3-dioxygenase-like lactoylglutathione lyase family enzyme